MAIDFDKTPEEQLAEPTGPILERPDHDEDEDLPFEEGDFEEIIFEEDED